MNEQEKQNHEWAEEGFWTGHYHYLLQALAIAANRCQVWRLVETGDVFTLKELFEFAKAYDTEHPLQKDQFYMVTIEGAIGLSIGVEYITKWLFTPMEPGRERDFLLQELQETLDRMAVEEESASEETIVAEAMVPPTPAPSYFDDEEDATVAAPPPMPGTPRTS